MVAVSKALLLSSLALTAAAKWHLKAHANSDCTDKRISIDVGSDGDVDCIDFPRSVDLDDGYPATVFKGVDFRNLGSCKVHIATSESNCEKGKFDRTFDSGVQDGCFKLADGWKFYKVDGCPRRAMRMQSATLPKPDVAIHHV